MIVLAEYRGRGFGKNGLDLLCDSAKKNGVNVLYDDILSNNPSVNLFLKNGFELIYSIDKHVESNNGLVVGLQGRF